jgi:hypothetical protein
MIQLTSNKTVFSTPVENLFLTYLAFNFLIPWPKIQNGAFYQPDEIEIPILTNFVSNMLPSRAVTENCQISAR